MSNLTRLSMCRSKQVDSEEAQFACFTKWGDIVYYAKLSKSQVIKSIGASKPSERNDRSRPCSRLTHVTNIRIVFRMETPRGNVPRKVERKFIH